FILLVIALLLATLVVPTPVKSVLDSQRNLSNGNTSLPELRIVQGQGTSDGQFPYHVLITAVGGNTDPEVINYCGGSIIGKRYVVTAASCATDPEKEILAFYIQAGSRTRDAPRQESVLFAFDCSVHPEFDRSTLENDIALIRTQDPFDFSTPYVIPKEDCQAEYTDTLPVSSFTARDIEPPNTAACYGDAGGPATQLIKGKMTLVGIISFGSGNACDMSCQGLTNVALFTDWIYKKMIEK
uniref:Uncharacterized protein n=1 Tax=Phlebotomus papatasi TaxID=29031 RepID=A0A1B0DF58_PHLPP